MPATSARPGVGALLACGRRQGLRASAQGQVREQSAHWALFDDDVSARAAWVEMCACDRRRRHHRGDLCRVGARRLIHLFIVRNRKDRFVRRHTYCTRLHERTRTHVPRDQDEHANEATSSEYGRYALRSGRHSCVKSKNHQGPGCSRRHPITP